MTDETTPEETPTPTTPATEEPTVNLAEEVGKGLKDKPAEKAAELVQQLSQELSPEQIQKMDALVESKIGSAIDGHRRKMEEDFAKRITTEGYSKSEDVEKQVEEALAFERLKSQAALKLDRTLTALGAPEGSEAYKKVQQAYQEGLESKAYTVHTLLTEQGIKSVAFAAGVTGAPKEESSADSLLGLGAHTTIKPRAAEVKHGDLDRRVQQRMLDAMNGS
jgi:hypothetical protein